MKQLSKLATFAVAILTLGFLAQSCTTTAKIDKADLAGYWSLKTLKGEVAGDAFKGSVPSLEFDFDKNLVTGSGGCNRYTGPFTIDGNVFKAGNLASTMMMCVEANKEDLFTSTLASANGLTLSVNNGVLTFKDNSNTVLEFNKGEAPVANRGTVAVTADNLKGTWTLSQIKGKNASELFGENPATLVYGNDGAVNGNAGCNNYRSKATLDGGTISFGPMMSTKMACPHLEGEQIYSTILSEPVQATINGNRLIFFQKGVDVLEFVQSAE